MVDQWGTNNTGICTRWRCNASQVGSIPTSLFTKQCDGLSTSVSVFTLHNLGLLYLGNHLLPGIYFYIKQVPHLHGAKVNRIMIWIAFWIAIQKMYPFTRDIHCSIQQSASHCCSVIV